MTNTIDMQLMRYINLFYKVSRVSTTNCFLYNNAIIFAVPKRMVSLAIGKNAVNAKRLSEILGKKVKIIAEREINELQNFVSDIVEPVTFNKIELSNGTAVLTAGKQSKAALIGRNRTREEELQKILSNFYGIKEVRIA